MRDTPFMLVELSVVEQRYQAVLAVIRDGVPVAEGSVTVIRAVYDSMEPLD